MTEAQYKRALNAMTDAELNDRHDELMRTAKSIYADRRETAAQRLNWWHEVVAEQIRAENAALYQSETNRGA